MKQITWSSVLKPIGWIKPTPNNFKIKNALGFERFKTSVKNFGRAGNVICNADGTLVDGNTRWEDAKEKGEKKIWCSVPDRKLTPKEFTEMSALFDFAKAGDVDIERVEKEIFKTKDIYAKWGMQVPMELLEGMGTKAKITAAQTKEKEQIVETKNDVFTIQLFFTSNEEKLFRQIEERLMKKFKTKSTTETVLKALKSIKWT